MIFSYFLSKTAPLSTSTPRYVAYGADTDNFSVCPSDTTFVMPWRGIYLALKEENLKIFPALDEVKETNFDGAFLFLSKHKALDWNVFLQLFERVKPKGFLLIHGAKNIGALSFYKKLVPYFPDIEKIHKQHNISFFLKKEPLLQQKLQNAFYQNAIDFEGFRTWPGMFSHGRVDPASQFLTETLPNKIFGKVADFGTGWGYLAAQNLEKFQHIDLYEADYLALNGAKYNVSKQEKRILPEKKPLINYFWHDIESEAILDNYDTILSNPPFHEGKRTNIHLGQNFLKKAALALKKNGSLYFVANKHLPYESALKENFKHYSLIKENQHFKILKARQ